MKKLFLLLLLPLLLLFPNRIYAESDWTINNFSSDINILKTGQIKVVETIDVDFNNIEKHGIYRDLPYVYDNKGVKLYTKVDNIIVKQDQLPAKTAISTTDNNLRIKIGEANRTIIGKHNYQISYTVAGVLKSFNNFDELYWNVTGNNWDADIIHASATVHAPNNSIIQTTCFEGYTGSTNPCKYNKTSNTATFENINILYPSYGLTAVVDFKKGTVPILTVEKPKTFFDNLISWPSISTFIISLIAGVGAIFYLWLKYGRDYWFPGVTGYLEKNSGGIIKPFGSHEPVVVEFTPPENLPPALIGLIVDEQADTLDVTSTIIDLASRGFLTITEIPKKWIFGSIDYKLKQTKKDTQKLLSYEKELLTRIFTKNEILTSELKLKFYDDLKIVKEKLYKESIDRGYFSDNPEKIRGLYLAYGFVVLIISFIVVTASASSGFIYFADLGFAGIITGIIIIIFSRFMPRRTAKGRELYRRIKGYRMFIDRAESYKQKFFENKNIFTDVLPYAIVFGMTKKFANQMKNIGLKPNNPTWYTSSHAFNVMAFSSNINSFSSSISNAIASAPSSSGSGGSGFSGGGFGGGGGGSW